MAQSVLDQFAGPGGFETITFIPAASPPHRQQDPDMAEARHRFKMVQLATASHPDFRVSDIELHRPGPSYTIETVEALATNPDAVVPMIIGSDALAGLASWHRPADLIRRMRFLQVPRPEAPWVEAVAINGQSHALRTEKINMPLLAISSTHIRSRLSAGLPHARSLQYMVPGPVRDYILQNGLYQPIGGLGRA